MSGWNQTMYIVRFSAICVRRITLIYLTVAYVYLELFSFFKIFNETKGFSKNWNELNRFGVSGQYHWIREDPDYIGTLGLFANRVEFRERVSTHVHSFILNFNVLNKYWQWNYVHRVCWENNKCTVAKPFEWSRASSVS